MGYRSWNFDGNVLCRPIFETNRWFPRLWSCLPSTASLYRSPFSKMPGKQVDDTPEDAAMLNLIWDNICSDFGSTYSHIDQALDHNMYMLPWLTEPNGTKEIASFVESYEKGANKALDNFMKKIQKIIG